MTGIKADRRAKELAMTGSQVDRHTLLRGHGCRSVREGLAPPATAHLYQLRRWTSVHPDGGRKFHCVHSHAKVGLYSAESATEADSALQKKSRVQERNAAYEKTDEEYRIEIWRKKLLGSMPSGQDFLY